MTYDLDMKDHFYKKFSKDNNIMKLCTVILHFTLFKLISSQCHSGYCEADRPGICPKIIEREAWGARRATDVTYAIIPVNYTIIHHTATGGCETQTECIKLIQSIQTYHLDEVDFGDIGYNFLIGGDGNVYEGCGWHRAGAHTYGVNSLSIGIAFIGDYMEKYPSLTQIRNAKDLITCAVKLGELFPDYKLYGARQIISTSSPGKKLYREIQTWPHWSEDQVEKAVKPR